ncbi:MAG: ATP-dependent RecD-like DNA helicase [Clostridia bacterium]|nr:ATP-dependent RecD-like DNA helicase [Clostridia bacterium]
MSEQPEERSGAEQLEAVIEDTIFRNEENGYSVVEARAGREKITVVGTLPALAAGEQVLLSGMWVEHPQYGKQWKATACEIRKPTTLLGIERYLGSGLIRGIGPATAKLLVQEFGKLTLDILSEHPERLTEVPGIGRKRAEQLAQSFREQYAAREAMVFLQSYGVPATLAVKISKVYGADAQRKIRENPYRLIDDIEGVGFLTADRIALSLGIPQDSEYRIRAGIKYALQEAANGEGHTYLPRDVLLERASKGLRVGQDMLLNPLDALLFAREIIALDVDGTEALLLSPYFYAEKEIARYLKLLMGAAQTANIPVVRQQIRDFENQNSIQFSENQRRAVSEAVQRGLLVITGGPGTGKTTIINCILALLGRDVLLAAPTGRAAKRMSEATGHEAKTLHRLLEFAGDEGKFLRDEQNPLDCACVIVDEMSMVDVFLMRSLLRALRPGTKLIMVGDADQLPSVGAGNVLGDILKSGVIPSVRLTDIFRQSEESLIVVNAHRINHGEAPILNQKGSDFFFERRILAEDAAQSIVGLCQKRLPAFLHTDDPARDIQVLSPTKKAGAGVYQLNVMLQAALNPAGGRKPEIIYGDTAYRLGDKVMHVKNNYQLPWKADDGTEGEGVFNGDVGFISKVDTQDRIITVRYDDERTVEYDYQQLEELELAYCLSVHKSQGSEFPCVVMPVVGGPPRLLTRNLFYTALTRARKLVVLVGKEEAIAAMVRNNHIAARYTTLLQRLREEIGTPVNEASWPE